MQNARKDTSIYICNIYAAPFSFIPGLWKLREPREPSGGILIRQKLSQNRQLSTDECPEIFCP